MVLEEAAKTSSESLSSTSFPNHRPMRLFLFCFSAVIGIAVLPLARTNAQSAEVFTGQDASIETSVFPALIHPIENTKMFFGNANGVIDSFLLEPFPSPRETLDVFWGNANATIHSIPKNPFPAPVSEKPILFLHGVNQNANRIRDREIFTDLLTKLDVNLNEVITFEFAGDRSLAEGGLCSTGQTCDSQTSLEQNTEKLKGNIEQLFRNSGNQKVNLVSYSMGAAIIRGYIARYADEASQFVENVVFLEGAQQGSHLLLAARGLVKTSTEIANDLVAKGINRQIGKIAGIILEEVGRQALKTGFDIDISRPAAIDLTPQSAWYASVNPQGVAPDLNYYNFFGDIKFQIEANLYVWKIALGSGASVDAGDYVLLPGRDNPAALPFLGGARFLAPTDASHESLQWNLQDEIGVKVSIALLRRLGEEIEWFAVDPDFALDILGSKVRHSNLERFTGEILVEDRTGGGGFVSLSDEIVALLKL